MIKKLDYKKIIFHQKFTKNKERIKGGGILTFRYVDRYYLKVPVSLLQFDSEGAELWLGSPIELDLYDKKEQKQQTLNKEKIKKFLDKFEDTTTF